MELFSGFTWILFGLGAVGLAGAKGHANLLVFLLCMVGGPVALLVVLGLPDERAARLRMSCPNCGESIMRTAKVCRYCGHRFGD